MRQAILKRREFIKTLGILALSVQVSSLARAQTADPAENDDALKVLSGKSRFAPLPGHLHYLFIPLKFIENPPAEGIKLSTTWAYYHHHNVKLTAQQLFDVSQGRTVTVADTVSDHLYTIQLSKEQIVSGPDNTRPAFPRAR